MANEIQHGSSAHNVPIAIISAGVRVNATDVLSAPLMPVVDDIIGEDGTSLGAAPNFGLNAAPVVTQDTPIGGGVIVGAYRISFVGRAAQGGVFRGGETYRILWSAETEGAPLEDELFLTVAIPRVELKSPV
jgi:hypothetical protein